MFVVHLAKEPFKFSCSHFTIFSADHAERLHGHNYQLRVDITVEDLDRQIGMAFDFNAVKPLIRVFCDQMDERILLPSESPYLNIKNEANQIEVRFAKKFYSFPREDVYALPLSNITAEELARHASLVLADQMRHLPHWTRLTVNVEETRGQSVSYTRDK